MADRSVIATKALRPTPLSGATCLLAHSPALRYLIATVPFLGGGLMGLRNTRSCILSTSSRFGTSESAVGTIAHK